MADNVDSSDSDVSSFAERSKDASHGWNVEVGAADDKYFLPNSKRPRSDVPVSKTTVAGQRTLVGALHKRHEIVDQELASLTKQQELAVGALTRQNHRGDNARQWVCDVCNVEAFDSYEEACAHEAVCKDASPWVEAGNNTQTSSATAAQLSRTSFGGEDAVGSLATVTRESEELVSTSSVHSPLFRATMASNTFQRGQARQTGKAVLSMSLPPLFFAQSPNSNTSTAALPAVRSCTIHSSTAERNTTTGRRKCMEPATPRFLKKKCGGETQETQRGPATYTNVVCEDITRAVSKKVTTSSSSRTEMQPSMRSSEPQLLGSGGPPHRHNDNLESAFISGSVAAADQSVQNTENGVKMESLQSISAKASDVRSNTASSCGPATVPILPAPPPGSQLFFPVPSSLGLGTAWEQLSGPQIDGVGSGGKPSAENSEKGMMAFCREGESKEKSKGLESENLANVAGAAQTTLDTITDKEHREVLLGSPEDSMELSDLESFVRMNVEAFSASYEHIVARSNGRGPPDAFAVRQVGVRCIHCSCTPPRFQIWSAVCYPTKLSEIQEQVMGTSLIHFPICNQISQGLKSRFASLMKKHTLKQRTGRFRKYWVKSAKRLGLEDAGVEMIRFSRRVQHGNMFRERAAANDDSPVGTLVQPKDRHLVGEFYYQLYQQVEPCTMTQREKHRRRSDHPAGFIGIACRHCNGEGGKGQYFPSSVRYLSNTSRTMALYQHVVKCVACPAHVKEELLDLRHQYMSQGGKTKYGSLQEFFNGVWDRLHPGGV